MGSGTKQAAVLGILDGSQRGPGASLLRMGLAALACLYVSGLKLFLLPYRLGIRRQARLPCRVVSVGNLTVGGTGKTPVTRLVCELVQSWGMRPCVLSRGYRGARENAEAVVSTPDGIELGPAEAGDEAFLLARLLPGVPVVVGRDRRRSGKLAWDRFRPDVIVLDDGMQFYQLHRDIDIVLLDALRPFDNGWTFPRGLLREPPSHLRRAGIVVITNADKVSAASVEELSQRASRLAPGALLLKARYAPHRLRALHGSCEQPVKWLRGRAVAALSGIGNPAGFEAQLRQAGANLVHAIRFEDHYDPKMGDLTDVIDEARRRGAEAVIVTEKDAVKLPPLGRPLPFYALETRIVIEDTAAFEAAIQARLH